MMRSVVTLLLCCVASIALAQSQDGKSKAVDHADGSVQNAASALALEETTSQAVDTKPSGLFAPLPLELVYGAGGAECDSDSCVVGCDDISSSKERDAASQGFLRKSWASGGSLLKFGQLGCGQSAGNCKACESARKDCFRSLCDPPCCQRNWVDVDFMLFFSGGYQVPALVAGSAPGTPRPQVGILGDPATNILLGNESLADDGLFGARIQFGRWMDDCGTTAIVGSLFGFGNESLATYPSDPNAIVSRPFFNVDPNVNALDAELVNYPGIVSGAIDILSDTNVLSGAIGVQRRLWCCANPQDRCRSRRVDGFVGFRSFSFDESLVITERLLASGGLIPANTTFDVVDRFETESQFTGIEFGLSSAWQRQRWSLELGGRIAFGNLDQDVIIDGSTTITVPGQPPVVQPYGILAGTSNIGTYERDQLGVLSQLNAELGYQLSCRWRITMGYQFIMLNDVVRPGDLIDLNVNGTHIDPNVPDSGPNRPAFDWVSETLMLHGLTAGFEFTF